VETAASAADEDQAAAAAAAAAGPKKEVSVYKTDCEMVTPLVLIRGNVELTTTHLYFRVASEQDDAQVGCAVEQNDACVADCGSNHRRWRKGKIANGR
jgi:hypothetical protein